MMSEFSFEIQHDKPDQDKQHGAANMVDRLRFGLNTHASNIATETANG